MARLGERGPPEGVRQAIALLCQARPFATDELARALGRGRNHTRRVYVTPMVRAGPLVRTLPDRPRSPNQRCRAKNRP